MTDELDILRNALKAAPPAANAEARAANLALAMKNFDQLQGSTVEQRPNQDRPDGAGFLDGVRKMLSNLTRKPALAATTSVVALAIGLGFMLPALNKGPVKAPGEVAAGKTEEKIAADPVATPTPQPAQQPAQPPVTPPASSPSAAQAEPPAAPAEARIAEATPAPRSEAALVDMAPPAADMTAAQPALEPEIGNQRERYASGAFGKLSLGDSEELARTGVRASAAESMAQPEPDTETYANAEANPVKLTAEEPVSTFSTDVDTASWAIIRSTISAGVLPRPEQVRIEEMINYFPYQYPAPEAGEAFATTIAVMPTPWNAGTRLVTIGLQGALPEVENRPPLNLVFLIDTSGSMEAPNKLGLLKQSLALMLAELRPEDQVAIVAYAGSAGEVLAPTKAGERDKILRALDSLSAGGSTAGAEGLELAYRIAGDMTGEGEVSRILLATDGDFNVGISDPDGLEAYVAKKRQQGTYLSVLGFGRGNLDDQTMQALAQNGNGTAAYIDTLSEARKVLVDQLTGALFPIADDVKVQVEWNPAQVAEYRLIGYETRALKREDFNNDKVDAGEIGAGLQVTAIYEIAAPGSTGLKNDPLRYGAPGISVAPQTGADELGFLRLRWKEPGESVSQLKETPILTTAAPTEETRFAAAIAGFGQLLQGSDQLGEWGWQDAITLATENRGADPYGYRVEAVNLMRLALSLAR